MTGRLGLIETPTSMCMRQTAITICEDIGIAFSDSLLGTYIQIADPLLGPACS